MLQYNPQSDLTLRGHIKRSFRLTEVIRGGALLQSEWWPCKTRKRYGVRAQGRGHAGTEQGGVCTPGGGTLPLDFPPPERHMSAVRGARACGPIGQQERADTPCGPGQVLLPCLTPLICETGRPPLLPHSQRGSVRCWHGCWPSAESCNSLADRGYPPP